MVAPILFCIGAHAVAHWGVPLEQSENKPEIQIQISFPMFSGGRNCARRCANPGGRNCARRCANPGGRNCARFANPGGPNCDRFANPGGPNCDRFANPGGPNCDRFAISWWSKLCSFC